MPILLPSSRFEVLRDPCINLHFTQYHVPPDLHGPTMSSITQLLSPWPITKSSIVLREQLIAQSQNNMPSPPRDNMDTMQRSEQPPSPQSNNGMPKDEGDSSMMTARSDSDRSENGGDGRKGYGKRELSTSKRAAQNRAAQVRYGPQPVPTGLLISRTPS